MNQLPRDLLNLLAFDGNAGALHIAAFGSAEAALRQIELQRREGRVLLPGYVPALGDVLVRLVSQSGRPADPDWLVDATLATLVASPVLQAELDRAVAASRFESRALLTLWISELSAPRPAPREPTPSAPVAADPAPAGPPPAPRGGESGPAAARWRRLLTSYAKRPLVRSLAPVAAGFLAVALLAAVIGPGRRATDAELIYPARSSSDNGVPGLKQNPPASSGAEAPPADPARP